MGWTDEAAKDSSIWGVIKSDTPKENERWTNEAAKRERMADGGKSSRKCVIKSDTLSTLSPSPASVGQFTCAGGRFCLATVLAIGR